MSTTSTLAREQDNLEYKKDNFEWGKWDYFKITCSAILQTVVC